MTEASRTQKSSTDTVSGTNSGLQSEPKKRKPRSVTVSLEEAQAIKEELEKGGTIADVLGRVKHLFKVDTQF